MIRTFLLFALIAVMPNLYAQDVNWLNKNVHPLRTDSSGAFEDFAFLSKELENNKVIGIGEASHGTHEFYLQKKRLITYLVNRLNYKVLGFEMPAAILKPVNQYLLSGNGNLHKLMKGLYLYNTTEIYDLFKWIRMYNQNSKPQDQVVLFGFDDESFWSLPLQRDQLMAGKAIDYVKKDGRKAILWAHNVHVAKDTTMAQYKGMGVYLKESYKAQYYVIALDTYEGKVNVLNGGKFESHSFISKEDSFTGLFAKSRYPSFYISFKNSLNPFVGLRNDISHFQSNWVERRSLPIKPDVDFDALIFIRNSSASQQLDNQ